MQLDKVAVGSVNVTPVRVMLPVFVNTTENTTGAPAVVGIVPVMVFATDSDGPRATVTVATPSTGGVWVESPVAVFVYVPASTFAWVKVRVAVQTIDAPTATV